MAAPVSLSPDLYRIRLPHQDALLDFKQFHLHDS